MPGSHIAWNVVTNVRWAGQVARMGRGEVHSVLVRKPDGRRALGRSGLNERIILKWIFKKSFGGMYWIRAAQQKDRSPTPMMDIRCSELSAHIYQNTWRTPILRSCSVFSANFVNK
jgi:hypothetical protein